MLFAHAGTALYAASDSPPPWSDIESTAAAATAPDALSFIEPVTTSSIQENDIGTSQMDSLLVQMPEADAALAALDELTTANPRARRFRVMQSVCTALENNQSLRIERLRPEISNTSIESARGAFDTYLDANIGMSRDESSRLGSLPEDRPTTYVRSSGKSVSKRRNGGVSLSGQLPTGTNWQIGFDASRNKTDTSESFWDANLNLNITQNLLKGAGTDVNLVQVRTAQNNFVISLYQLQQVVINLVTDVLNAYWDLYLSTKTVEIRRKAYEVAKDQRIRTEELVRVGRATPLDILAAQGEESARVSDMINASADFKRRQIQFLRLINPNTQGLGWNTMPFPTETPKPPSETIRIEDHVRLARHYRPDLRQAEIDLANGDLEVVRTANGLLPALDFVTNMGLIGSGDNYNDAVNDIKEKNFPNWSVALQFSYPLQNRSARASYRRANFQILQAQESIRNFIQTIDYDVRLAIIEIDRTRQLLGSTKVTKQLRFEELRAEIEKYRVGRSTSLLVNQAQRDAISAALAEVSSQVDYIKSFILLYKVEGTTLQRYGIQPVMINAYSGVDN
ncbi:MAG: TolC family protein [bacterium]